MIISTDEIVKSDEGPDDERPIGESHKGESPEGDRLAKVMARAGLCSRREAERWITRGIVTVNGDVVDTPAHNVTPSDVVAVEGKTIDKPDVSRLWRYHKPTGLVTTHKDPQGRETVFDKMPESMPRVISVGRLDINSEGLLLLTNDGELARRLELPSNDWTRRYRVRVRGTVDAERLTALSHGVTVSGIKYGPIQAVLDNQTRTNAWLTVSITEGKNREIRKVMEHLGLEVNRLLRVAYGPFQLGNLGRGDISEIPGKTVREQMSDGSGEKGGGEKIGRARAAPKKLTGTKKFKHNKTKEKFIAKEKQIEGETPVKAKSKPEYQKKKPGANLGKVFGKSTKSSSGSSSSKAIDKSGKPVNKNTVKGKKPSGSEISAPDRGKRNTWKKSIK